MKYGAYARHEVKRQENVTNFEMLLLISVQWIDDLSAIHLTSQI